MFSVNENSSLIFDVSFIDPDGELMTPVSATYRLDDYQSGASIIEETAIGDLDSVVEIALSPSDNAILNQALFAEKKVLTVRATYGQSDQVIVDYTYLVRNLQYVT